MNPPTKLSPLFATTGHAGQPLDIGTWRTVATFQSLTDEMAALQNQAVLVDVSPLTRIQLEGEAAPDVLASLLDAKELAIGQGVATSHGEAYCLRPDLWLVIADSKDDGRLLTELASRADEAETLTTVTDFSDAKAHLWLSGPAAATVLNRVCGLYFHEAVFPSLSCAASSVAKTTQLIIQHAGRAAAGEVPPAYSLIGDRSFAVYLWETLLEAGQDLGLAAAGWALFESTLRRG